MGNNATTHSASEPLTLLYKDDYVSLDEQGITIHWYYFPFGQSKRIHYEDISKVTTNKALGLEWLDHKGWGMGLTDIWWALDMKRSEFVGTNDKPVSIVIQTKSEKLRKGFSSSNPDRVLSIIRSKIN
eukprot:TRINITY_DN5402_c0_g1_i1.p1 TRINITY_DN5402_c0_g1~~TRINITY_DN5402_c0_g1_i1.p1  ORF type:complete len:128 (+),score=18.10 TRINITY_DN5402_c0_g1_i1:78-461(+)